MSLCALLMVALLVHDAAGSFRPQARSSIAGGKDASVGQWPWMAYLTIIRGQRETYCGGTLISDEWVLTAAHCLEDLSLEESSVKLGMLKLEGPSEYVLGISDHAIHPDYEKQHTAYLNDIALVKLSKTVNFSSLVDPIALAGRQDKFGLRSECWITGWGFVAEDEPLAGNQPLQQAKVSIVNWNTCKNVFPGLTSDMVCAVDRKGKQGACKGDSGGPLVCSTAKGFVQVGIVSFGHSGCGNSNFPGVYTEVAHYIQFINEEINFKIESFFEA